MLAVTGTPTFANTLMHTHYDGDDVEARNGKKETANVKIINWACPTTTTIAMNTNACQYGFWLYHHLLQHIQQNLIPKKKKDDDDGYKK